MDARDAPWPVPFFHAKKILINILRPLFSLSSRAVEYSHGGETRQRDSAASCAVHRAGRRHCTGNLCLFNKVGSSRATCARCINDEFQVCRHFRSYLCYPLSSFTSDSSAWWIALRTATSSSTYTTPRRLGCCQFLSLERTPRTSCDKMGLECMALGVWVGLRFPRTFFPRHLCRHRFATNHRGMKPFMYKGKIKGGKRKNANLAVQLTVGLSTLVS